MKIQVSRNFKKLPPYLFVELDRAKRSAIQQGRDIIDLGVGDPDLPTPKHIINELCHAAEDPQNHRYALDQGMPQLRKAISQWYKRRFSVSLNPDNQIQPLIGSKEGIAHLPFVYLNKGDYAIIPDPCYPPYRNCAILAGARPYSMPLLEKNDFLPDLAKIPQSIAKKSKMIFINYPNNPTASVANNEFFKELLRFSRRFNIIVASDLAYSEISFNGYKPSSILEFSTKNDLVIEFHSLSKTYNMTGWRIGWACGNKAIVSALARFKSNIDSGIFGAIQRAGICALKSPDDFIISMRRVYQERRDILIDGLNSLGWKLIRPKATFYLWIKVPNKFNSWQFSKFILDKQNLVVTPGSGFGKYGEGYIRIALTVDKARLKMAVERFSRLNIF